MPAPPESGSAEAAGIAIVVPVLDEERRIARVLDELREGLPGDRPIRLIVADGGSRDRTAAIVAGVAAADPRVTLVGNPRRFQSAAVNQVAADVASWARWLVRCDAHTGYPPGFVASVVAALERSGAESVVVPMDSVGDTCVGRAIAWVSDTPFGSGGSAHRGGRRSGFVDHGHHAGWRLDAFRAAGGYDESFAWNEDAEFDCRLRAAGGRVWLDADIRLDYHVRPTLRALWRQYRGYGEGRSRTVRRHPSSLRLRQFAVPAFVGANALALLAAPIFPAALLLPASYLLLAAATSIAVAVRRRSRCGLFAGPAGVVMHLAWASGFAWGMATIRERRADPEPGCRGAAGAVGSTAPL